MGFRNLNKPAPGNWDHVCAQPCADSYRPPPHKSSGASIGELVTQAVCGAAKVVSSALRSAPASKESTFKQKAARLDVTSTEAERMLRLHGGDEAAALQAIAQSWVQSSADEIVALEAQESAQRAAEQQAEESDSSDESVPSLPAQATAFSSDDARAAVYDVFSSFVAPLLPKPQGDGSFRDGDAELLDALMLTPITLGLPRAERLSDLIRPEDGWSDESLQRARSFFTLSAAGVSFLLFLPSITHRQQLARSQLFAVKDSNGDTVGVRDCCPWCRCNTFTNVTDGSYNIRKKQQVSRNGVRFLSTEQGNVVPISRTVICRSPTCPSNVAKLEARGLAAAHPDRPLPRSSKAPDGRQWPSTSFATHSIEYIKLVAEVSASLGAMYLQYTIFGEGGCDATLAARLMRTSTTVSQLCKELTLSAKLRERMALERYVAYMHEQRLQLDDSLPQLPSALELARSSAPESARLTSQGLASCSSEVEFRPAPSISAISNSLMRRFLALRKHHDEEDDDDNQTTTETVAGPKRAARLPRPAPPDAPASSEPPPVAAWVRK